MHVPTISDWPLQRDVLPHDWYCAWRGWYMTARHSTCSHTQTHALHQPRDWQAQITSCDTTSQHLHTNTCTTHCISPGKPRLHGLGKNREASLEKCTHCDKHACQIVKTLSCVLKNLYITTTPCPKCTLAGSHYSQYYPCI